MTCREKLKLEYPEYVNVQFVGGCNGCPRDYGYLPNPSNCVLEPDTCTKCWDREISGENADGSFTPDVVIGPFDKNNTILDSGDRTEFESGAVRDMHEGKGRCDLMPLDVIAVVIHDEILGYIYSFQKYGSVPALLELLRKQKIFPDIHTMFLEVAKHFEDGCNKYGEDNWRKGIPCKVYIDSAVRHYLKYLRGDTDERHDRAFIWNIMCCIWTYENKRELRGGIGGKSI